MFFSSSIGLSVSFPVLTAHIILKPLFVSGRRADRTTGVFPKPVGACIQMYLALEFLINSMSSFCPFLGV
jgi:hypothetical protein